jgi:hypothetical protein
MAAGLALAAIHICIRVIFKRVSRLGVLNGIEYQTHIFTKMPSNVFGLPSRYNRIGLLFYFRHGAT